MNRDKRVGLFIAREAVAALTGTTGHRQAHNAVCVGTLLDQSFSLTKELISGKGQPKVNDVCPGTEASHVLFPTKRLSTMNTHCLKKAIAIKETAIAWGDGDLIQRQNLSVKTSDWLSLAHACAKNSGSKVPKTVTVSIGNVHCNFFCRTSVVMGT